MNICILYMDVSIDFVKDSLVKNWFTVHWINSLSDMQMSKYI